MQSKQFANAPDLPGMCYGFYELIYNQHRFITHAGDTNGTHSFLLLDPAQDVGFFVSTNGAQGQHLIDELVDKFVSRYYGGYKVPTIAEYNGNRMNDSVAGEYRNIRYARNTLDKLILLFTPQVLIKIEGSDLLLQSPYGEGTYRQIGPMLFKNVENGNSLSFRTDNQGNISFMFTENPTFALEKVLWYESNNLHMILFGASILLSFAWSIHLTIRFIQRMRKKAGFRGEFARIMLTGISIVNIFSLIGIIAAILSMDTVLDIGYKLPLIMQIILSGQIAMAALTGLLIFVIFSIWVKGLWKLPERIFFTLVAVSNVCFTAIMCYYNLIGIKY